MTIQLTDTLTRRKEIFAPLDPANVRFYVCGPTVYDFAHIGNARPVVVFDVLFRLLRHVYGPDHVTYVRNITDVDDKIIAAAVETGRPIEEITARFIKVYNEDMGALGVLRPDVEPRATEHIDVMIGMIEALIEKGHAYEAEGHVLFDVESHPDYGALSKRDLREMIAGARVEVAPYKKTPQDFVLWKPSTPELPGWDSPWGRGRPGWHIECSAMAEKHLGDTIDIHGGGQDLIFPHHENEIAQSEAAEGDRPFARYWMHNGMLTLTGEKMSKSTGHVMDLLEAVEEYPPLAVRLFYLRTHYRKPLDVSEEALQDAAASLERLWSFRRRTEGPVEATPHEATIVRFREAMEDDFDVAGGLGALFEAVRDGNRVLDDGGDAEAYVAAYDSVMDVLGLAEPVADLDDIADAVAALATDVGVAPGRPGETIDALLERRREARAARDFALADRIRSDLAALGVVVEDAAEGTRWFRQ